MRKTELPRIAAQKIRTYLDAQIKILPTPLKVCYPDKIVYDWREGDHKEHHGPFVKKGKYTPMSLADFSLVGKDDIHASIDFAKDALENLAGHQITYLVTEILRQGRHLGRVDTLTSTRNPDHLKMHEKAIFDRCFYDTLRGRKFGAKDVVEVAFEVWQNLRAKYFFYKKPSNSKNLPLYGGSQIAPEWVAWQWLLNPEHLAFEEGVFAIHSRAIKEYLEYEYSSEQNLRTYPVESDPENSILTKEPIYYHVDHGPFKMQYKGELDSVMDYFGRTVVIAQKYTDSDDLASLTNRLRVLLHSLSARNSGATINIEKMRHPDVTYLYQIYDFAKGEYYYLDASVTVEEFRCLQSELFMQSLCWLADYKNHYKELKTRSKRAFVAPHLPYPDEVEKFASGFVEYKQRAESISV